jgi:O-acetyl-ADP-ribose deacetylase (regulator of RNase III)
MPKVFINFRGRDHAGYAALLDRELSGRFGAGSVFLSSRSIVPGDDFVTQILSNVRNSTVLLAIIGPDWMAHGKDYGPIAFGGTADWVHREIAEALAEGVRVIPVLVEGALMPAEGALPSDIAALSRCQYLRLHHRNIAHDISRILEEVGQFVPLPLRNPAGRPTAIQGEWGLFRLVEPHRSTCRIGVMTGTIRHVRSVAIWVNSENTDMVMPRFTEFSVSAIIRYLGARRDPSGRVLQDVVGEELAARVGTDRPVAACTAFVTGSGALAESHNVHHIIHVAAVEGQPGAGFRQVRDVGSCVTAALTEAERLGVDESKRTILFPILGAGVADAPIRPTVATLVYAAVNYLTAKPDTALTGIHFLAHTEAELDALAHVLTTTPRLSRVGPPGTPDAGAAVAEADASGV